MATFDDPIECEVQQVGGSLMVRIPREKAREVGIDVGSKVVIRKRMATFGEISDRIHGMLADYRKENPDWDYMKDLRELKSSKYD